MPRHAIGSALLLCLGLATIILMVGYAFLRSMSRAEMSGKSEMLIALAREAALCGTAHAEQQAMIDHYAASLPVAGNSGTQAVAAAPTFLDGPYRAPFVSLYRPNDVGPRYGNAVLYNPQVNADASGLLAPFFNRAASNGEFDKDWHDTVGAETLDGRGRYIEPGYLNLSRPDPSAVTPEPVSPVRFTDFAAAAPELDDGLFLDEHLRRITTGTVADRRKQARYRLRYTLGVIDLDGHLLSNPVADLDWDWRVQDNGYRKPPQWLDASAHAWLNMVACWPGSVATTAQRMSHIFRGRGVISNTDRKWMADDTDPLYGLPATFPWMFRTTAVSKQYYWGHHTANGEAGNWWRGLNHAVLPTNPLQGGRLYEYVAGTGPWDPKGPLNIRPSRDGGQVLTPIRQWKMGGGSADWLSGPKPYVHAYLGPQQSWFNQYCALSTFVPGSNPLLCDPVANSDGPNGTGLGPMANYLLIPTPFGRRLESVRQGQPLAHWYQGRVDTPWHVNLLTAPPQVVSSMILAYLPPELKTLYWNREDWYIKIGEEVRTGSDGKPYTVELFSPTVTSSKAISVTETKPGLDLLNDQLGNGFREFPAPSSPSPTTLVEAASEIKPDYFAVVAPWAATTAYRVGHAVSNGGNVYRCLGAGTSAGAGGPSGTGSAISDNSVTWGYICTTTISSLDTRWVQDRYPGPLCRGDSALPVADPTLAQGSDDLGELIDADTRGPGWCTHTGQPLVYMGGSDKYVGVVEAPPSSGIRYAVWQRIDTSKVFYKHSYFWDMAYALSQAISIARAGWVQYPSPVFNPAAGFNPATLRDPLAYDSIEEIDALFLRQLGESQASPGSFPANPIVLSKDYKTEWQFGTVYFTVSPTPAAHNIRSLRTADLLKTVSGASSADRAKVMERMLNDFRLSFLGASPKYSDTFRPLDFDGDGKAMCSAYMIHPSSTLEERNFQRTARWTAAPTGRGDPLTPFNGSDPLYAAAGPQVDDPRYGPRATPRFEPDPATPWFCATGCFFIGKSHYFRFICRGEVFDNYLMKPVATQTLEKVVALDPTPSEVPKLNPMQTLFQRWHYNIMTNDLPRQAR